MNSQLGFDPQNIESLNYSSDENENEEHKVRELDLSFMNPFESDLTIMKGKIDNKGKMKAGDDNVLEEDFSDNDEEIPAGPDKNKLNNLNSIKNNLSKAIENLAKDNTYFSLDNITRQDLSNSKVHSLLNKESVVFDSEKFIKLLEQHENFEASRYEIFHDFGKGGICTVKKAWDRKRAKFVAIKIYKSKFLECLFNEIKVYYSMKNPKYLAKLLFINKLLNPDGSFEGAVLIIEAGVCDLSCLVSERGKNGKKKETENLEPGVEQKTLSASQLQEEEGTDPKNENFYYSEKELVQIMLDVSLGLQELTDLGINHYDLKELNILYCRNPSRYILIDFNISHSGERNFNCTAYFKNFNVEDEEYDIWCLGLIVLNLINFEILKPLDLNCLKESERDLKTAKGIFEEIVGNKFSEDFKQLLTRMLNLGEPVPKLQEVLSILNNLVNEKYSSNKLLRSSIFCEKLSYLDDHFARQFEFGKVLEVIKNSKNPPLITENIVANYKRIKDYDICFKIRHQQITDSSIKSNMKPEELRQIILECLELSSISASNTEQALKLYNDNIQILIEDTDILADLYRLKGILHKFNFEFNEAYKYLMLALAQRFQLPEIGPLSEKTFQEQNLKAVQDIVQKIYNKMLFEDHKEKVIEDLRELGLLYAEVGLYEFTVICYSSAKKIFDLLENKSPEQAYSLEISLLSVDLKIKNNDELIEAIVKQENKNLGLKADDISLEKAYSFMTIGQLYELHGNFRCAMDLYRKYKKLLQIMHFSKFNQFYIRACLLKAKLFSYLLMFDKALPELKEALRNCKSLKNEKQDEGKVCSTNPLLAECYQDLGYNYFKLGIHDKAKHAYDKAAIFYEDFKNDENNQLFQEKKAYLKVYQAELSLQYPLDRSFEEYNKEGMKLLTELLVKRKINSSKKMLSKLRLIYGLHYLKSHKPKEALDQFRGALGLLGENQVFSLEIGRLYFYYGICHLMISSKQSDELERFESKEQYKKYINDSQNIFESILPKSHPERIYFTEFKNIILSQIPEEDPKLSLEDIDKLNLSKSLAANILNPTCIDKSGNCKILESIRSFLNS